MYGNRQCRRITGEAVLVDDTGDEEMARSVAECTAWLVPTHAPRVSRHGMEGISQGLFDMAVEVFDDSGKLRPWLQSPSISEGTTVWEGGFGCNKVILVDEVRVYKASCQRHGIGKR